MTAPDTPRDPRATIVLDPTLTRAAMAVTGVAVAAHALVRWRRGEAWAAPDWVGGELALAAGLWMVAWRWRRGP